MIPDRARTVIAQRLTITDTREDVLRAERRVGDQPISVYYFDFGERVLADDFNLGRYVQDQIATDFYRHEGSLQWNYYLYFVPPNPSTEKLWATKRAVEIESDRVFARKFVRDQGEIEQEFGAPLAPLLRQTTTVPDIAARWVTELNSAGLEAITNPEMEYTKVVATYLESSPASGAATPQPTGSLLSVPNGTHLQELYPVRFRPHPSRQTYRFGRVNLIRGSNGAGKTSLLEAIELAICGGIRRQNGENPAGARLLVRFAGESAARACPETATQGYRQRDLAWYGAYRRKGNHLCENFARFNFFDSDAAFQLSAATSDSTVEHALRALFLGQFATTIEERMRQCLERFETAQKQAKQEQNLRRDEIEKARRVLAQIKDIKDTREVLLQELHTQAAAANWKKLPARLKIDDLASLAESVKGLAEQFGDHAKLVPWVARPSIKTLSAEAKKLAEASAQLADLTATGNDLSETLTRERGRARGFDVELKQLNRLVEYHEKPERFALHQSAATLEAIRTRIRQLRQAAVETKGIDLSPWSNLTESFGTVTRRERDDATKRRKNLTAKKTQIETLEKELSTLQSLVAEIKGLGRRYCEAQPTADECPLCGTVHGDLAAKIAELKAPGGRQDVVRTLMAEVRSDADAVAKAEVKVHHLERVRRAVETLGMVEMIDEAATRAIVTQVAGIADALTAETTKLDEANVLLARQKAAGYSESELKDLLTDLEDSWDHAPSRLQKADSSGVLLKARIAAADENKVEIKSAEKKLKENQDARARLIRPLLGDASLEEAKKLLGMRASVLDDMLTRVFRAQKSVTVSDPDEFSSIGRSLTEFGNAVERIQKTLERIETKDTIERAQAAIITEANLALQQVEPRLAQATRAVAVLHKLLQSAYEHALLDQALNQQKSKISTIFSRIHSPHEFDSVSLNGTVKIRRKTGIDATIAEVSAGQRAALALSIFLSMNSGVGPKAPWLLFDDPVVHVDDLNTLSFLDLLRDVVMDGDRQVFFATASARIGDLFARKFDCLGDDFVTIALQREMTGRG